MGKLISWIVLSLFVLVVPLGSWFYLQQGLDFRKASLAELKVKDSLNLSLDTLSVFKGNVSLIVMHPSTESDKSISSIKDQFKNVPSFTIFENGVDCPYQLSYLKSMGLSDTSSLYAVIDTSGRVRSYYKDNSLPNLQKLVEHIAIIMPKAKEMDIQMKNQVQ